MTMTLESFILYNIIMATLSWYLMKRHGTEEYDNGFYDAVILHEGGRLIYSRETVGTSTDVLMIEVLDEE